ncbi:MAG: alpha/beta fold hydrolase [Longimicrobiales bacterium]
MTGMGEPRTINVGGHTTRYYDSGSGFPVVFIYGGNFGARDSASSATTWEPCFALSDSYRLIAFDKVGQGYTDNPLNDDYTMAAVTRHAIAFVEAMGLVRVHLVGHSRGGYTAVRMAMERPDLVRSLTVINSGTLSPGVSTNDVALARPPHPSLSREAARWLYRNYVFDPAVVTEAWVEAAYAVMSQPKYQESVRKMWDEQYATTTFFPNLGREKRETLTWIAEGRLQRPTQIFWGLNDRTATMERAIELRDLLAAHERQCPFHVFAQCGHFPFQEHPQAFNGLLDRFIAAVDARRR